jgi:hypothetical protein
VELLLAGATFNVPSPCAGTFAERQAWPGEPTPPGRLLGYVEEETDS